MWPLPRYTWGVCIYIKESVKTERLQELEDPTFKVLQSYIRPPRLPRGINCVITTCVYHPPSSNNTKMLEYLSDAIPHVEGLFPGCGIIIIAGDFKQLDTKHLCWDFCPKQLVHQPTWGTNILDLVLTNMYNFYDSKPAVLLPPFGLSDHNAVAVWLKTRVSTSTPSRKIVKRDICLSHKMKLGQYLFEIDWYLIKSEFFMQSEMQVSVLCNYDWLQHSHARETSEDSPEWPSVDIGRTEALNNLVSSAFSSGNNVMFIFYQNKVNRMRKSCQGKYFAFKAIKL